MADIADRLRKLVIIDEVGSDNPLGQEAADEIERLRATIARREREIDLLYSAIRAASVALDVGSD